MNAGRTLFLTLLGALAALLPGCGTTPRPATALPIPSGRYAEAFDAAREALRDLRFDLERVDARLGVITSRPHATDGLATPWDLDQTSSRQEVQDLMHQQRRRVRLGVRRGVATDHRSRPEPKRSSERVARKGVSFARVELPDGPIVDLFTTHMQSGYDAPSARVRKAQLDQIRAFVDQKSSRENATIVCGDFNINGLVDARDGEYASMLAIFDDFSDPFADDDDITYHPHETHNPLAHRFEPEAPVQRVDYILYRRGGSSLELTECGLWMKEPLAAIEGHPKVHASDHFGLCVTLKRTHE